MPRKIAPIDVMTAIALAFAARGLTPINKLDNCAEIEIGHWWIAANGHPEPRACSHGPAVLPFHAYVEWHGWPAGLVSAFDMAFVAHPDGANIERFVRDLATAIA